MAENTAEIHLKRGDDFLRASNYVDAKEELELYLKARGDDDRALHLLATTLYKLKQYKRAAAIFKRLIEQYPEQATLHTNLGLLYLKDGSYARSVECLRRALELNPGHGSTMRYLDLATNKLAESPGGGISDGYDPPSDSVYASFMSAPSERVQDAFDTGDEEDVPPTADSGKTAAREFSPESFEESSENILSETSGRTDNDVVEINLDSGDRSRAWEEDPITGEPPAFLPDDDDDEQPEPAPVAKEEPKPATVVTITRRPPPLQEEPEPADEPTSEPAPAPVTPPSAVAAPEAAPTPTYPLEVPTLKEFSESRALNLVDDQSMCLVAPDLFQLRLEDETLYSRTRNLLFTEGGLTFATRNKKFKGKETQAVFGTAEDPIMELGGTGKLLIREKGIELFTLEDEMLYVVEDFVYAFEDSVRWENGRLPMGDIDINLVQFKGKGRIAVQSDDPVASTVVNADNPFTIHPRAIIAWFGKLIPAPKKVENLLDDDLVFLQLKGEGTVLFHRSEDHIREEGE